MLDVWDGIKQANPRLNNAAVLNMVAETIFGVRLNVIVRRRHLERLKRTLRRYQRW
jgi:hypothetical protein